MNLGFRLQGEAGHGNQERKKTCEVHDGSVVGRFVSPVGKRGKGDALDLDEEIGTADVGLRVDGRDPAEATFADGAAGLEILGIFDVDSDLR